MLNKSHKKLCLGSLWLCWVVQEAQDTLIMIYNFFKQIGFRKIINFIQVG